MANHFVQVASFTNAPEAYAARAFLDASGIEAVVDDETVGTTLAHMGGAIGGVKVLVAAADVDRARQLLQEAEHGAHGKSPEVAWTCPGCGEKLDGNFNICWKCGTARDGSRDPSFDADEMDGDTVDSGEDDDDESPRKRRQMPDEDDSAELPSHEPLADAPAWNCPQCGRRVALAVDRCWACGTSRSGEINPYHSPMTVGSREEEDRTPEADEATSERLIAQSSRAWRAAVIGLVFCPPLLNLYSIWLLLELAFDEHRLPRAAWRRCLWGWIANGLALMLAKIYISRLVR